MKTASRVCVLGNKLARTMSRRDAFKKAWAIVKSGAIEIAVRGVIYGNRQEALRRLAAYKPKDVKVYFVPEPENAHDKNAVAVMVGVQWGRGLYKLGYVPRELTGLVLAMQKSRPAIRITGRDIFGARLKLPA